MVKMFQLKPGRLPPTTAKNIIFITRPEVRWKFSPSFSSFFQMVSESQKT